MNIRKAFLAGVIGAAVMSAALVVARAAGLTTLNLEMILGSIITQEITAATWFLGLIIHLFIGGVFGELYAAGFEFFAHTAKVWVGVMFGLIHGVIAGMLMFFMGMLHPLMVSGSDPVTTGHILAPGVFGSNYGFVTAGAFILLHVVFGAIVGLMYHDVHVHGTAPIH